MINLYICTYLFEYYSVYLSVILCVYLNIWSSGDGEAVCPTTVRLLPPGANDLCIPLQRKRCLNCFEFIILVRGEICTVCFYNIYSRETYTIKVLILDGDLEHVCARMKENSSNLKKIIFVIEIDRNKCLKPIK